MILLGSDGEEAEAEGVVFDEVRIFDNALTISELQNVGNTIKNSSGNIGFTQVSNIENWHGSDLFDTRSFLLNTNDELIKFNSDLLTINHGALTFTTPDHNVKFQSGADKISRKNSDKSVKMANSQSLYGLSGYNPSSVADGFHLSFWYLAQNNNPTPTNILGFGASSGDTVADFNFEFNPYNKGKYLRLTDINGDTIASVNLGSSVKQSWKHVLLNIIHKQMYLYFNGSLVFSMKMPTNPVTRGGLILNVPKYDIAKYALYMSYDQIRIGKGLSPTQIEVLDTEQATEILEQAQHVESFENKTLKKTQVQTVWDLQVVEISQTQTLPSEFVAYFFSQKQTFDAYQKQLFEQLHTIQNSVFGRHLFHQGHQVSYYNPIVDVKDVVQPHDDYELGSHPYQYLSSFDGVIDGDIGGGYTLGPGKRGSLGMIPNPNGNTYIARTDRNFQLGIVAVWVEFDILDIDKTFMYVASMGGKTATRILILADGRLKIEYLGLNYLSDPYEWIGFPLQIIMNTDPMKNEQRIKINGRLMVKRDIYSAPTTFYGSIKIGEYGGGVIGRYDSIRALAYGASEYQEIIIEKDETSNGVGFTNNETLFPYTSSIFSQKSSVEGSVKILFSQRQSLYQGKGVIFVQSQTIYVFSAILSFTQVQTIDESTETIIIRRVN